MKIILLAVVLLFSCGAYDGHSQIVKAREVKELTETKDLPQFFSVAPGLISWWTGEGNTDDIVGVNHGIQEGGATFAAGRVGQAFLLDGVDDSIDLGNAPNLHVSAGDFTVGAWVLFNSLSHPPGGNLGAPQGDMSIMDKMSTSGVNEDGWRLIKQDDNRFYFCLGGGEQGNQCGWPAYTVFSTTHSVTGVWFHVAAVKSSRSFAIYINGVLEDERSPVPPFTDTNSAHLRVGSYPLEGAHLNGLVDEVQVYNRALSNDEILAIFEDGCAGGCIGQEGVLGTIGSQLTITGSDFGDTKGKVTVGGKSCKVLQWAADSIICEIRTKLPAGTYDVVVHPKEPKGGEPIIYERAFTMMAPEILSIDPGLAPTREIEVSGAFFGTRKGRVYLLDAVTGRRKICKVTKIEWGNNETEIREKPCRVKEWTMDTETGASTFTFTVFKRLRAGTYGIEVVNKAGKASALFTVN